MANCSQLVLLRNFREKRSLLKRNHSNDTCALVWPGERWRLSIDRGDLPVRGAALAPTPPPGTWVRPRDGRIKLKCPGGWFFWEMSIRAVLVCQPHPARPENGEALPAAFGGSPVGESLRASYVGLCPLAHSGHTFSVTLMRMCASKTQLCG